MPTIEPASAASERGSTPAGRLARYADGRGGRGGGAGPAGLIVALLAVLGLAAVAAWVFSQPLDGKGTISASQLAAQEKRPATIHGIRKLRPGEGADRDEVAP
jgi:hypothetical protein